MDESLAALDRYNNSQEKLSVLSGNEHRELRYRNHYNSGIIFYEEGNFDAAAASFREALKSDPSRIDAKRNLEISLMSITKETSREKQPETHNETKEMLFQYIRQQEQQYWQSHEWAPEESFTGPDY